MSPQLRNRVTTEEGKAAVSQNAWRHGLTGAFAVLPWESEEEYVQLALDLRAEHQPSTPTEALLVDRLAQHHWLMQRAITLQGNLMDKELPLCEYPMNLALFMRYQTTHERAFHKCLAELAKLRAERRKAQRDQANGFESQKRREAEEHRKQAAETRREAAEIRQQELHIARLRAIEAKIAAQKPRRPALIVPAPTETVPNSGLQAQQAA